MWLAPLPQDLAEKAAEQARLRAVAMQQLADNGLVTGHLSRARLLHQFLCQKLGVLAGPLVHCDVLGCSRQTN